MARRSNGEQNCPGGLTPAERLAAPRRTRIDAACSGAPYLCGWRFGGTRSRRRIGALLEQRNEALLGHRLAEQKALAVIATHADQRQRVGRLLDTDGDRDAAEIMRQIDHRLAQRRVDLVAAAVGDEGAVELDLGERQFLEPRK